MAAPDHNRRTGPPPSFGGGDCMPPAAAAESDAVTEWLKWHAVELVGIGVPLALALAVSPWFALLAIPAAALWAAHGIRQHSRTATGEEAER